MTSPLKQDLANKIKRSAARLAQLCDQDMPTLMIETERQILTRLLFRFPVDMVSQAALLASEQEVQRDEQLHLQATGYYRGVPA